MRKVYNKHTTKGQWTISIIAEDGTMMTARVHGIEFTLDTAGCKTKSAIVERFHDAYRAKYGDDIPPVPRKSETRAMRKGTAINGYFVSDVRIQHVHNAENDCIASGYVWKDDPNDKKECLVLYSGECFSSYGNCGSKPWLRQARIDLVNNYIKAYVDSGDTKTAKRKHYMRFDTVDNAFINRLADAGFTVEIRRNTCHVSVADNVEAVFKLGDRQTEATRSIRDSLEKVAKIKEADRKEVDDFFNHVKGVA